MTWKGKSLAPVGTLPAPSVLNGKVLLEFQSSWQNQHGRFKGEGLDSPALPSRSEAIGEQLRESIPRGADTSGLEGFHSSSAELRVLSQHGGTFP